MIFVLRESAVDPLAKLKVQSGETVVRYLLSALAALLAAGAIEANAATYLARGVDSSGNPIPVAELDADNAPVPTDGTCDGCVVITKAQRDAYLAAHAGDNLKPTRISQLQFLKLLRSAGGVTMQQIAAARADANLAGFWVLFDAAATIERDDPDTQAGLSALLSLHYLAAQSNLDAVLAAWPMN